MNAQQVQVKERIRGPKLAVFITSANGVPMEEAIRRVNEARLVIASNKRLGQALLSGDGKLIKRSPCWSGTMTCYTKSGSTFRQESERIAGERFIVSTDFGSTGSKKTRYLFPVDEEYLDKKNCILAVDHPGFELVKDGDDRIVRAARIDLIENFPASNGWNVGDPKYGIPSGARVDDTNEAASFLWRKTFGVSLVVRGDQSGDAGFRRGVCL